MLNYKIAVSPATLYTSNSAMSGLWAILRWLFIRLLTGFPSFGHHIYKTSIEKSGQLNKTKAYRISQRMRKKIEELFGEAKEFMMMREATFRGKRFLREQVLQTAAAQNIKRMVKLLARKEPERAAAVVARATLGKTHAIWVLFNSLSVADPLSSLRKAPFRTLLIATVTAAVLLAFAPAAWSRFPGIRFIPVSGGFKAPVHIANAGDGSGRLFVVEQRGAVRIISGASVLPLPFLDISGKVLFGGERGLLNVTFPPQFAVKQYFYVNYTRVLDGATVIARYHVTADPNIADPASEEILLVVIQPFPNHNGGMMAFSPVDGYLYIGMGDGGSSGDPNNFAQNISPLPGNQHLLGKLLRIDVESGVVPYAIPPTNPLFSGVKSEIWARGLRNPWKFSFDRQTGALYLGDVGEARQEEINFRPASSTGKENYGWRILEGSLCAHPAAGCIPPPQYVPPVTEYSHDSGCSVTGGYVYRGAEFPVLNRIYLFGDFCSGIVWGLQRVGAGFERKQLADTSFAISTFGEGEDGSVFVVDRALGNVFKIAPTVTVLFPDGGELISAGSQQTIRWAAPPDIKTFNVQFSLDNGLTWITVGQRVTGKSILWNVPPQPVTSSTCRVRIIGFNAAGVRVGNDTSDKTFTITSGP